jgi:predicted deacylase
MLFKKSLTLALLVAAAAAAQAQGAATPLSLEQVRADFLKARAAGQLPVTGEVGEVHRQSTSVSQVTRAQVLNELRARGPVVTAEGADAGTQWSGPSVLSRSDVQAEAVYALKSGKRIGGKL